jgi:glycosyltransferase involved in cell wall biosynthesis
MVKASICIVANSDLLYDQRLQRISSSLRDNGYAIDLLGRLFTNGRSEKPRQDEHLKMWFQKGKLAYLELNLRIFFWLLFKKYDAICSVDLDTLPACWLASKLRGFQLIQDSHEYMAEVPEVASRPLTRWMWHQVAKLFLPSCDLNYTVSASLVEEFRKVYHVDFQLIRNISKRRLGQNEIPYPDGLPKSDFLVFLGAVNMGRGLEELLPILVNRTESIVVLGDGDRMSAVRKLVIELGLEDRVFLPGKVSPEMAAVILKQARAGLNLLTDEGLSYRYSLANKFFDYVQAGIPQVCIAFPEYEILLKEFKVGITCNLNPKDLNSALDFIAIPENRLHPIEETAKAALVWNWQEEEKELLRLYDGLFVR